MTDYQKQIVTQLLKQAGYKEQEKWWENNDIKSAIMKAELFADDPHSRPSLDIVDELRKANPYDHSLGYKEMVWDNCCDKLKKLLNQKEGK